LCSAEDGTKSRRSEPNIRNPVVSDCPMSNFSPLAGIHVFQPRRFEDERGFFCETWNYRTLLKQGVDIQFVQDNHSMSTQIGTLRGLHYQTPPHAQDKLVRCTRGTIFDVAVDIRTGSPTYGQWYGVELSAENGKQLLVPKGFLHGFITRTPETEVIYKCSDYYAPACDACVRFDDPDICVNWGFERASPVLSEKDRKAPFLRDIVSPF